MLLITVDDVIASMGLTSSLKNDLSDTIISTISKAQVRLCNVLGSPIELFSCVDKVYLSTDLYAGVIQNGMLKVKLANMFVDQDSISATASDEPGVPGSKVKPLLVNAEQGEVFFPVTLDKKYVTISYDSGFDDKTIPRDLKEALLLYTALIFSTTQPGQEAKSGGDNPIDGLALESIAKYRSVSAFSFRPFSHVQET